MSVEAFQHRLEHDVSESVIVRAELQKTQQQQGLLRVTDVCLQVGADGSDSINSIQVVSHLVGHTHVAVKVYIEVGISNAEMITQVIDEHLLCPFLVHLLYLAK